MQINLKVFRFNPEKDQKPHFDAFSLEVDPKDRILDVLEQVRGYHDGSLGYRRSCAHGVCGSDAMRVNGRNYLACKILVQDLKSNEITVEPILGLKVIKDLIVDMEPFFRHFESVKPYFVNDDPLPADGKERLQSPEDRERFDDTTKCILCAACTTSCPSFWADGSYVGPAAIVNAHRFIFDTRDKAAAERLKTLNEQFGVWRCRTVFNCTEACPRDIHVTQAIAEIKQALLSGKLK
ncbi:MAG TPA: succinate dehydrogenase iron-sulfur subunit [Anaerolineaceae bacterium]|jgi:succinate dehydrogenase / fumarate reductase iron-sulfur subunit